MRKPTDKERISVDPTSWTGEIPRARPKPKKLKPLRKWQIVLGAIMSAGLTLFSWAQVLRFLMAGEIEGLTRSANTVTLAESPIMAALSLIFWFGWAAVSAWFAYRIAASPPARKRLMDGFRKDWRKASWFRGSE